MQRSPLIASTNYFDPNNPSLTEYVRINYTEQEVQDWQRARQQYLMEQDEPLRKKTKEMLPEMVDINISTPAAAGTIQPVFQQPAISAMTVPVLTSSEARSQGLVKKRERELAPPKFGDKEVVLTDYKKHSLCATLTNDALERIRIAVHLLDEDHANQILGRLNKAGVTRANASHVSHKDISYRSAISIALQAERWVYQAQAAAAKAMVKETKKCLHNMAGHRKPSRAQKESTYMTKYGVERKTSSNPRIQGAYNRINNAKK